MAIGIVKRRCYCWPLLPWRRKLQRSYSTNSSGDKIDYLQPQTSNHNDLPSFLEYASRNSLDLKSTTYVGTHYEYTVQAALRLKGMSLARRGGKSDNGIDLLGTWSVSSFPDPLKVLVQCKAYARKIDPATARELEGTFAGAPQGWRGSRVLALLVAPKQATKGVRDAIGRSRWPMGYVLCERDGSIKQMLWNRRAEEEGLGGLGVDLMYTGGDHTQKKTQAKFAASLFRTYAITSLFAMDIPGLIIMCKTPAENCKDVFLRQEMRNIREMCESCRRVRVASQTQATEADDEGYCE
ncbi:hypothetical protein B7463_g691, partial [Scytalidium lignicola]